MAAERKFIDDRVMKIIELKNKVSNLLTFITSLVINFRFAVAMIKDLWSLIKRFVRGFLCRLNWHTFVTGFSCS